MATRFLILGLVAGVLAAFAAQRAHDLMHNTPTRPDIPVLDSRMNEEFEAIERSLRDPRDREWTLIQDMQPCYPGSRLCFLLSHTPHGE